MEKNGVGGIAGIDGYLFRLIATFEAAAMQQLGKIAHPLTGDVEVDLEGASDSIEMLAAIQRKTEGNLNDEEKRLLQHVLYQIRMNYVDVARERDSDKDSGGEPSPDDQSEPAKDGGREESDECGAQEDGEDTATEDSGEAERDGT